MSRGDSTVTEMAPAVRRSKIAFLVLVCVATLFSAVTAGLMGRSLSLVAASDNTAGFVGGLLGMLLGIGSIVVSSMTLKSQNRNFHIGSLSLSASATFVMLITSIVSVSMGSVGDSLETCGSDYYYIDISGICTFGIGAIFTWFAWVLWAASLIPASIVVHADEPKQSQIASLPEVAHSLPEVAHSLPEVPL